MKLDDNIVSVRLAGPGKSYFGFMQRYECSPVPASLLLMPERSEGIPFFFLASDMGVAQFALAPTKVVLHID